MGPKIKNGPPLAGHSAEAEAVHDTVLRSIVQLPKHLRLSLSWGQGAEMARHAKLTLAANLPVYFCDPHNPWQRGTNENTIGLLRPTLPEGTDLGLHGPDELAVVAAVLNGRPR